MSLAGQGRGLPPGEPPPRRVDELLYRIRGLGNIGHVLHVGVHPDDEDAGLMAYVARKYGARIVYWSATRGEAGQNRVGAYAGAALGVYRTWESLAARAIDGGESMFGPFYDFGYTTNRTEAETKWGRRALVREIVRAIRLVQPLVLIARFAGDTTDGHGQHQAVGAATLEAFAAAADPALFPELALPAWRTVKLYQATGGDWQPGEAHSLGIVRPEFERDGFLRIDTGEHDPVVGGTYQQRAVLAFNCHQTQAMGLVPERGPFYYYYQLKTSHVATKAREESIYDGLDPSVRGLGVYAGASLADRREWLNTIGASVDSALRALRPDDALPAADPLFEGLATLRCLRAETDDRQAIARQLDHKIATFEDVILGCLGVDAECLADRAHVAAGEHVGIRGRVWNPRDLPLDVRRLHVIVPDGWVVERLPSAADDDVNVDILVPPDAPPTVPSWLREPHDSFRYTVPIGAFAGNALDAPPVALEAELVVRGHRLTLRRPAVRREAFPGGYRELALAVVPAFSVRPHARRIFVPAGASPRQVDLQAAVERPVDRLADTAVLHVDTPQGWTVFPPAVECPASAQAGATAARFRLSVPGELSEGRYRLEYAHGMGKGQPAVTFDPVWMGAPGLPRPPDAATCTCEAFLSTRAAVDLHVMSATFARGLKYGYVRGAAEGLLEALAHFDLSIHVITDEEMPYLDLAEFDTIVIGPNAYLLRDELRRNARRFLDYIAEGGTLIVQYQAYGYERPGFAPYPFDYSHPHDRVTDPDAPIVVLEPRHPLLTYPNPIIREDFIGWTHDRGLYFWGTFDDRYTPILACSDMGDELKRGGLVIAGHGRGAFVYVGYSLFRQVPAAVPGAFRLLANLLALPEALLLQRVERLKALSLFAFMSDEQLMAVARIVSETYVGAGTYLCRQGELGQELFIVVKGEVEIVKHAERGPVVLSAREGQVVGEFAILADIPRTADLRAATDVHVLAISSVHFRALLRQHTEIAESVIRQLVMKLAGG